MGKLVQCYLFLLFQSLKTIYGILFRVKTIDIALLLHLWNECFYYQHLIEAPICSDRKNLTLRNTKKHCQNDISIFFIAYIFALLFPTLLVLSVRCTPKVKKCETKSSLNYDGQRANCRGSKTS